jgi:hypothetical protein
MAWPTNQDYSEAVQNPPLTFSDVELKKGQVNVDKNGLPIPCSGAFAVVFKVKILPQSWAIKCFTSEILDQQRRYEAISNYLAKVALPYTVPFTFMQNGIMVYGQKYPLLKMQWVQGESLSSFVARSINYPDTLLSLAKVWVRMMADLKAVNIAHGDLQHGNIVVVGDQLKLIDYDGMFVPALAGQQSNEIGHRNYQLPSRSRWDYGPYLDNFSAWVIYVSLVALAVHPELWNAHQGGDECLIFRKEDFVNPANSAILRDLQSSPNDELRFLIEMFTSLFSLSSQDVPSLDGNLRTIKIEPPKPWWSDSVERPVQPEEKQTAETNRTLEEEPAIPDPGWIIDSLTADKPIEPVVFQSQQKELRIVAVGSLALVFLTRFFVEMPVSELFVMVSFVFGLNILLCFVRYQNDTSHAQFEAFRKESKKFLSQIREHQTLMDSISAERLALQEKLAKTERELAGQKNRLSSSLQAELARIQTNLNSQLQSVNQRRQETGTAETNKRNSLQGTIGNQISDLDRKNSSLWQQENNEKNNALASLQDSHIQNRLRSRSILGSSISGIGVTYKARLAAAGITTAADIDWRVSQVYGIGPAKQAALSAWRHILEAEARRSAPTLSTQDRLAIENKYRQERQNLEAEKQRFQSELNAQIASARQYFADVRQSLNQEEQQIRSANAYEENRIQQEFDARFAELDASLNTARNQVAPAMNELSEKIANCAKTGFALRWKSAKHDKEGRRFASLRFRDYMHKIVST